MLPSLYEPASNDSEAPAEYHDAETLGAVVFEDKLEGYTRGEVAEIENPDTDVEALIDKVEVFLHALDFGVADVGAMRRGIVSTYEMGWEV